MVSSFSPRNTEFAPARKHNACASSESASRPALRRTIDFGIRMRAVAIIRTSSKRILSRAISQRRPLHRNQHIDRNAFRMRIERRQLPQQPVSRRAVFAHADDAAAAYGNPGPAHARQRIQTVLISARGDDAAVEFGRRVEIVVVSAQAGFGQRVGLVLRQHAERAARFHAQRADAAHHFEHAIEPPVFGHVAPRRAHAETGSALLARAASRSQRFLDVHQILAIHLGVIARRLRTVRAILGAAAGFDAEQHAALHFVGSMMRAMDLRRAEHQIGERRGVDSFDFLDGPVVPERGH